jgi:hypothetical protein
MTRCASFFELSCIFPQCESELFAIFSIVLPDLNYFKNTDRYEISKTRVCIFKDGMRV